MFFGQTKKRTRTQQQDEMASLKSRAAIARGIPGDESGGSDSWRWASMPRRPKISAKQVKQAGPAEC